MKKDNQSISNQNSDFKAHIELSNKIAELYALQQTHQHEQGNMQQHIDQISCEIKHPKSQSMQSNQKSTAKTKDAECYEKHEYNERNEVQPMWKWILLGAVALVIGAIVVVKKSSPLSIKGPVTFDEYLKSVETCCDKFVLKLKKSLGDSVKGAKCELSHKSGCIGAVIKVYTYAKSKWILHEKSFSTPLSKFSTDAATQAKLAEIKEKPMLFDVEMPE